MVANPDELVQQAEQQLSEGNIDEAYKLFEQAHNEEASTRRSSPAGAVGMARIAILLEQPENAILLLSKVLETFPNDVDALNARGVADEVQGNLEEAIKFYKRAAKIDARSAVAHFNLGRVLGQMKRWKEAFKDLQIAVRLEPDNAAYNYSLAIAAKESGDMAAAIEALTDCLEIQPYFLDGYATLADLLCFVGKDQMAITTLESAIKLYPDAGPLYGQMAAIFLRNNDPAQAGWFLKKRCEVEPQNYEAWVNLNLVALMVLDMETAEQAGLKAIEVNPTGWKAYYQLGMVYDACGLRDKAEKALRKAIEVAPEEWQPYNNLGSLLMENPDEASWREATQLIEKCVALGPTSEPHVPFYNLALLYWKLGDKAKSKIAAEGAVQLGPPDDEVTADAQRFLLNFKDGSSPSGSAPPHAAPPPTSAPPQSGQPPSASQGPQAGKTRPPGPPKR